MSSKASMSPCHELAYSYFVLLLMKQHQTKFVSCTLGMLLPWKAGQGCNQGGGHDYMRKWKRPHCSEELRLGVFALHHVTPFSRGQQKGPCCVSVSFAIGCHDSASLSWLVNPSNACSLIVESPCIVYHTTCSRTAPLHPFPLLL